MIFITTWLKKHWAQQTQHSNTYVTQCLVCRCYLWREEKWEKEGGRRIFKKEIQRLKKKVKWKRTSVREGSVCQSYFIQTLMDEQYTDTHAHTPYSPHKLMQYSTHTFTQINKYQLTEAEELLKSVNSVNDLLSKFLCNNILTVIQCNSSRQQNVHPLK